VSVRYATSPGAYVALLKAKVAPPMPFERRIVTAAAESMVVVAEVSDPTTGVVPPVPTVNENEPFRVVDKRVTSAAVERFQ